MTDDRRIFTVEGLRKWYPVRGESLISNIIAGLRGNEKYLKAVDDVDFTIKKNEIVGLAGQSGCGKSTLGELVLGLQRPTRGKIRFRGDNITNFDKAEMKEFRRHCQIIFQDPYESLNPRFPVARIVSEPLSIHDIGNREEREEKMLQALSDAGLDPAEEYIDKFPGELSGGERQRVSIARALVLDPDFIVADEPVSMLDVSIRAGILNTFKELQRERNISMLYVSHNMETISYLTDRTMIMYMGDLVEIGPTNDVIQNPAHPYTEALLNAVPDIDPERKRSGSDLQEVPDPVNLPDGCRFHPHCEYATEKCMETDPDLEVHPTTDGSDGSDRQVACHHPLDNRMA